MHQEFALADCHHCHGTTLNVIFYTRIADLSDSGSVSRQFGSKSSTGLTGGAGGGEVAWVPLQVEGLNHSHSGLPLCGPNCADF